ncbi:MAG: LPS assembly lipoprotein LptE [Nitrospirota bacterium]
MPFDSIQIERIENKTLEPKLQDRLHKAITEEFLRHGITVYHDAGYKLSGTINLFELHVLSEKKDIAVEYEAVIKGDFRLTGPSGDTKDFKNIGSPFIVSFSGSGLLEDVLALKELASEKAVRDMAMEIVAILIYPVRKGDF